MPYLWDILSYFIVKYVLIYTINNHKKYEINLRATLILILFET